MSDLFRVESLDHLVLNCSDVPRATEWYERALGATAVTYDGDLTALMVGTTCIRLRPSGAAGWLAAQNDLPGALDICLTTATPVREMMILWESLGIHTLRGPVRQTGARGVIESIYTRDPDGNLIEVANSFPPSP